MSFLACKIQQSIHLIETIYAKRESRRNINENKQVTETRTFKSHIHLQELKGNIHNMVDRHIYFPLGSLSDGQKGLLFHAKKKEKEQSESILGQT